jgi:hypothetical protein
MCKVGPVARAVVAIGVSRSGGLPVLGAVESALDAVVTWAASQGITAVRISDADGTKVSAARVVEAVMTAAADPALEQLVVYFTGHGVNNNWCEYWLLSDAPDNPNEAINVVRSAELAERGSVPHVVLVSDACRTAPGSIRAQSVTGSLMFTNPTPGAGAAVDLFYACRLGDPAFEVVDPASSSGAYTAVYTEVLTKALSGGLPALCEPSGAEFVVRPWPLKRALPGLLGQATRALSGTPVSFQAPDSKVLSDPGSAYLSRLSRVPAVDRAPAPLGPPRRGITSAPRTVDDAVQEAGRAASRLASAEWGPRDADLVVHGASLMRATALGQVLPPSGDAVRLPAGAVGAVGQLALELSIGVLTLPVFAGLAAAVTVEDGQVVDVRWRPRPDSPDYLAYLEHEHRLLTYRAALGAASRYGLELDDLVGFDSELESVGIPAGAGVEDLDDLVPWLPVARRLDPSLVLYEAYARHDAGRRDVPGLRDLGFAVELFDVALLNGAVTPAVVPDGPLLARGWALAEAGADPVGRMPSHWTLRTATPSTDSRPIVRRLVLVHGRSQQHKDPVGLKQEWLASLAEGFGAAGVALDLPDDIVSFPYYGDTLADLTRDVDGEATPWVVKGEAGDAPPEQELLADVVAQVALAEGVTDADVRAELGEEFVERGPQNWRWVLATLRVLERVPGLDVASLWLATKDVYTYLRSPGVRDSIDASFRAAMSKEPTVVVAHSLGSIVAYNVLRREAASQGWQVPTLITVGCPLGVVSVMQALRPITRPDGVGDWFNAFDTRDVVALHPLDAAHFPVTPAVENFDGVRNPTSNRHGISGYLSDPIVARRISDALTR